uniref:At1g61320/AtMIF1 LRR domain-containing protein n=1 Tax=Leersia perrieri TaxID=77586 RepID=A0A0D9WTE3_9ORYZ
MVKRQREEDDEEEEEAAAAHQFGDGVVDPNHDPEERHDEEQQPATGDTAGVGAQQSATEHTSGVEEQQPATGDTSGVGAQQPATGQTSGVAAGENIERNEQLASLERLLDEDDDAATGQPSGVNEYVASLEQLVKEDGGAPTAKGDEIDRILALPERPRRRILDILPIKSVIHMGLHSRAWKELCNRYIKDVSVEVTIPSNGDPLLKLKEREQQPEPRPIRFFSLLQGKSSIKTEDFNSCVKYTSKCSPEIIHVKQRGRFSSFRMEDTSRKLVHLSLFGVKLGTSRGAVNTDFFFPDLKEIHLQDVQINIVHDLERLVAAAACPLLRVLDLRECKTIIGIDVAGAGAHLVRLTVMDGDRVSNLIAGNRHRLRSLHYSGRYLNILTLPANGSLTDLYISFERLPTSIALDNSLRHLPDLSNLTVLTLCDNSLRAVTEANRGIQRNFRSLRELQLLMSQLEQINLADIFAFLGNCRYYPQLEKLFVQLPKHSSNQSNIGVKEQQEHFEKLDVVKMTNFKYDRSEIQLLQFLFRRANPRGLRLILDCPKPVPEERQQQLQPPPIVQRTDDSTVKSFHSQLFDEKTN